MSQVQKEKYKVYLLLQMSRSLKCFNQTCKCNNLEIERVVKVRCKNCGCSIITSRINLKSDEDMEEVHYWRNKRLTSINKTLD